MDKFEVEFLIYRQFKVVNTILNAATDALGGFGADIRRLLFCFDGISHIELFLLPLILWFVLREKIIGQLSERGNYNIKCILKSQSEYARFPYLSLFIKSTENLLTYAMLWNLLLLYITIETEIRIEEPENEENSGGRSAYCNDDFNVLVCAERCNVSKGVG